MATLVNVHNSSPRIYMLCSSLKDALLTQGFYTGPNSKPHAADSKALPLLIGIRHDKYKRFSRAL
jgi:hypothetical protein